MFLKNQPEPERSNPSIPIGTYLAKLQYSPNRGMLPEIIHEDYSQPFHFAVLKASLSSPEEEYMHFHISSYPNIRKLCGSFHAMFLSFRSILGSDPETLESEGVRAAFKRNDKWNAIVMIMTPYRYPTSFLYDAVMRLNYVLSALFERPSYDAAVFAQRSLVVFMKAMSTVRGISSVLATYKSSVRQEHPVLIESDSILCEVGPKQLVDSAINDPSISDQVAIFVFGRVLYTTMSNANLFIAELLVANLFDTTTEQLTVDGRLFCLAKHFHTVMVTITEPGHGLEKCCAMQVSLMKLDSQGIITKMQQSFGKKLPPQTALDVLVVSGPFTVTHPPFIEAPLFASHNLKLQSNAIAAEIYEKMSTPGFNCIVDYIIAKYDFRIKYVKNADSLIFLHTTGQVDEKEVAPLPHMLKGLRPSSC
ncbi:hypothetical protein TRFO_28562 [Tritrichomonas foetus]|uniref:Uncharacterized protein n=1 Tax=Tritrichomonas foetus TaxID=1144522 RepID=A0A1J4K3F4_9EUKA|nr:hypothetical protein TRFO_28562 [Tritrichomonas foetus]|eukprot:OHT04021.1 hypothetical protein TRFO_28562 [Tritrichomonas foetus]